MKIGNGDWIPDRLAELVVVGYAVFFLWEVARSSAHECAVSADHCPHSICLVEEGNDPDVRLTKITT